METQNLDFWSISDHYGDITQHGIMAEWLFNLSFKQPTFTAKSSCWCPDI